MADRRVLVLFVLAVLSGILLSQVSGYIPIYTALFLFSLLFLALPFVVHQRRRALKDFSIRNYDSMREKLELFIEDPTGFVQDSRSQVKVLSTALGLAAIHFWLQWRYTFRYVHMGGGLAVVKTLNVFVNQGVMGIFDKAFQINNYTGNPIFLLPVIDLFGYSPNAVRIALIGSFAVSTGIFFLAYRRLFGYGKALLGTIFLFTMSEYIYFRWFDYTYVIFLISGIFYLYVRWCQTDQRLENAYMYTIAFLGGLFFYFKATILYLLAGIATAIIYLRGSEVFSWKLAALIIVFLSGAAPFIAYTTSNMEFIDYSPSESNDVSIAGPENLSVADSVVARYDQMGRWVRTDLYNLDEAVKGPETPEELFGYQFRPDNPPGGETRNPVDIVAAITGDGYERHAFSGFHAVTLVFLLVPLLMIYRRERIDLLLISIVFFVLMIFLPSTSGFRVGHMNIFAPFIVLLFIAAVDMVPERIERKTAYRYGMYAFAALMIFSILSTISVLEPNTRSPIDKWGGDQQFYSDFKELETENRIYTNSYKVEVISKYFHETGSWYVIPGNMTEDQMAQLPKTGGHPIGKGTRASFKLEERPNATLILREELPCIPEKEFCGASNEEILQKTGLEVEQFTEIRLDGEGYLIASVPREKLGELNTNY